ncbi:olfactory receptor 7D4-like [Thomomys bottae]
MEGENHTSLPQFLLLGLSDDPELQSMLFGLFLSMYLITVFGYLLIILAVTSDPHLHSLIYFFLSNLSFTDVCFTCTTLLKILVNLQAQRKDISYPECLTQMHGGFSDVHSSQPPAEPVHLQPEEPGCGKGPGETAKTCHLSFLDP